MTRFIKQFLIGSNKLLVLVHTNKNKTHRIPTQTIEITDAPESDRMQGGLPVVVLGQIFNVTDRC